MKKLLIIATVLGLTSSAMAADFTFKNVPLPPVRSQAAITPFFAGVNAGNLYDTENYTLGATAGAHLSDYLAAEVAYDHDHDNDANLLTGNLIIQNSGHLVTPYILGGVGYRWADVDESVWNVGAGAKVALTDNIDFDARYRHVVGFETDREDDVITGGLIFKF